MEEKSVQAATIMQQAQEAFDSYKKAGAAVKAAFLQQIAASIESYREVLVATAQEETHLPLPRLNGEISRTTGQLQLFANVLLEGSWVEAAIDMADDTRTPARPDIRKMKVPSGPVIVFGASNFPFAFSTAGGDTASALAAGCSVVIKAHPAHEKTSNLVYKAIEEAIQKSNLHQHVVQHVSDKGNALAKALVQHEHAAAVGFTGSLAGGKAIWQYANERACPIPVFAEMSSINPVVLFPDKLQQQPAQLAQLYAASITAGMGQFCTNPGLLLAVKGEGFQLFLQHLGEEIGKVAPQPMLHEGIYCNWQRASEEILQQQKVEIVVQSAQQATGICPLPVIAKVPAATFIQNGVLKEEVFGPLSLVVECEDVHELKQALQQVKGQLTTTLMATEKDLEQFTDIIALQQSLAGRIIINSVPTGVEVCAAMVHGGPFPATTDARFTSVGSSAIQRWVRPLCFQGFPDALLPDELKNSNPLHIWRIVNNQLTNSAL
ncbi:ketoglutarate semialdehyde dehydrogenase [Filimonas lacunae]|nr:ketoglutarate semialdehyde dehydrogenase [Filimonas lacunae]